MRELFTTYPTQLLGGGLLVLLGILVRFFPNLIAGYNTMSAEQKKNVDVKGLSRFMCLSLAAIGIGWSAWVCWPEIWAAKNGFWRWIFFGCPPDVFSSWSKRKNTTATNKPGTPDGQDIFEPPFRGEQEGAKDALPATLFDFRGAGFDTTRRGPDGTYFMYFPFGMSEKGRKTPHLQPFLILGVQVLTRRGEDRMGHTLCISQSG